MRLQDLHREVLDPHLQRGHPVHRLHKVSPPALAAPGPCLGFGDPSASPRGIQRGFSSPGARLETLPSEGSQFPGELGPGRGSPPTTLGKSLGPCNPSQLAGAVETLPPAAQPCAS